jgi:hypothetical protein
LVFFLRPMIYLLEDRIILATELWVAWGEEYAQLELSKGLDNKPACNWYGFRRLPHLRGIHSSAVLQGSNRRRLIGLR